MLLFSFFALLHWLIPVEVVTVSTHVFFPIMEEGEKKPHIKLDFVQKSFIRLRLQKFLIKYLQIN